MGESYSESPAVQDRLYSTASRTPSMNNLSSLSSSPRPELSRTNSVSYFSAADADDSFTGLTLLDALVVLDSHLDLASRNLKKKGAEWRSKAESTAIQVKKQAEEVINQSRRRTRGFRTPLLQETAKKSSGGDDEGSEEDRIYIDKELARFRENIQARVQALKTRWRDQRVVSMRDKISFFFGVELVLFSALLVGFRPQWVPQVYSALALYLFPIRIYEYRKKHYSLFLADLCYIVNAMCLLFIWVFPSSPILFVACYCLAHGPLCTAIATWRNSLVFHSVDKVTSLFIHIYPPFVFTVMRHFIPNVHEQYPALAELPHLNVWRSLVFSSLAYLAWQVAYYYGIVVARREKIEKQGRVTSFTWMLNNKRSLIGKTLAKIPPARREPSFMAGQFVYTIVTMAPSAIWLYDSKALSVIWLITFFSVSVWNGASFYFKVMSNFKEISALRKELDDLQKEAEGRKTPGSIAGISTPATSTADSGQLSNLGEIQELHLGESLTSGRTDKSDAPILGASGATTGGLMDTTTMIKSPTEQALRSPESTKDTPVANNAGTTSSSSAASDTSETSNVIVDSEANKLQVPARSAGSDRDKDDSLSSTESDTSAVVVEKEE